MVPTYLSLSNFLSYGEQVPPLDFTQFHVACLTGDNGHGKSALLDAITYALWGEARKSTSERKPDEGLLRLGASEMRVEFGFDLDDNRFRIIRSFRKGRRTNATRLDFQVFDQESNSFRTLSERASLSKTQQHINQVLSMDYDTFINSAFIVQGRADEFTQKNARQRKEILAEILGLSRYDRLQERAWTRFQESNQSCRELQRRLQELNAELAHQGEYEEQLRDLSSQLETLGIALAEGEKTLEALREQRLERGQLQHQLTEANQESARGEERLRELEKEQDHLRAQQHKDSEILAAAATIQQEFDTYQQLTAQDSQLRQQREQQQELEKVCRNLETRIVEERHKVEKRCEKWEARRQTLERQAHHSRALLEQRETIESRYNLLLATRQQEQALEKQRVRHEALQHEESQTWHHINLEKQRLATQQDALETRRTSLQKRLREKGTLEGRLNELQRNVDSLLPQIEKREQLRETGSSLRAQHTQAQQQLHELEEARSRAREKMLILQDSSQAECPLCGSALDEAHRLQLDEELARQEQVQVARIEEQRQAIQKIEDDLQTMRHQYQLLEQQIQPLETSQQELAAHQARLAQFREIEQELHQLEEQLAALGQALSSGQYATSYQQRLGQISEDLAILNYQPEQRDRVTQTLRELAIAEADFLRLQDARQQEEKTRAELDEATEKLELARQYLEGQLYAQSEQRELEELQRQIRALAYDPAEHQRIGSRIDELSAAVAHRERLIAAQQRHASTQETIAKNDETLKALHQELQDLSDKSLVLEQRTRDLEGVDLHFEELSTRLVRTRAERDQFLQRQGSLQAQLERCAEGSRERDQLQEQLGRDQREAWVYQHLSQAFGKDGIQALIIENAIPEIEQETNAILARLTDNRIQIAIESLRDLKKGGTRETLDIKIADEIGERSYHLYSGGEAFRTNFALRIALSKILAKRAGTRLRTLVIDEGFGTQDSQGLEQLVEAIQEISKDFDKLLVVTHLPELKQAFPVQIEVTKHPDIGSRFEIIRNT